jgi:Calx-beta domain/Lamin Tail Domain
MSIPHLGVCAAAIALCASLGLGISSAHASTVKVLDASGAESAPSLKFRVKLNGRTEAPVRVTYATIAGSATPGTDFKVAKGQVSFQPDKKERSIVVMLISDTTPEGKETFGLKLTKPAGATIGRARATGTIRDDDPPQSSAVGVTATSGPPNPPKVVINELLPDPLGTKVDYEYVELLNASISVVDLSGWTINSGSDCALSGMVGPGATYVVSNDLLIQDFACPLTLLNTGDTVTLRSGPSSTGTVIDALDYNGFPTAAGESLSLDPSYADPAQNDLAGSWCEAKEAGAATYDPEGNYGTPGTINGSCGK